MSNDHAIEVSALSKTYRSGFRRRVAALKAVSLEVQRGEIFSLLGPNGAGKTTMIKVLLGIVRKTSGTASLLGRPAGDRASRKAVGFLPENHRIPRHHTPRSCLNYYGQLSGLSAADVRRRRGKLLATVGLADWETTSVKKFSKGMLQRLGLAQALLHDPELLILDEPTDGLDPVGRSHVREILLSLKSQGKTVFLNSHLLQEVELVSDRVAVLDKGEVKRVGPIGQLTGRNESQVVFDLAGDETQVRRSLDHRTVADIQRTPDSLRVVVDLPDQRALDQCIDALRAGGVSILSLSRRRDTLEKAFLDILKEDK